MHRIKVGKETYLEYCVFPEPLSCSSHVSPFLVDVHYISQSFNCQLTLNISVL